MLSYVQLFMTPCTAACQTPLSMELSRQEYWSGLPFPTPEDLPDPPEIKPMFFAYPALAGRFVTTVPQKYKKTWQILKNKSHTHKHIHILHTLDNGFPVDEAVAKVGLINTIQSSSTVNIRLV